MGKKVIFIDLDGTLKCDQKQVSKKNIDSMLRAKAAGHEIVFSTGRSFMYIDTLNKECGDVSRYAVSSTGSIVYDFKEQKILASSPIPKESAVALCKLAHPDAIWLVHCTDGLYSTQPHVDDQNHVHKHIEGSLGKFIQNKTVGAICIASPDFDLIKDMEPRLLAIPGIQIANRHKSLVNPDHPRRGLFYYDIIAKSVSKGSGVKALCDLLGIPKADRIAIGDDMNDLSMFAECDTQVAMGNALAKVRDAANKITDDNNNSGVAKFLDLLLK